MCVTCNVDKYDVITNKCCKQSCEATNLIDLLQKTQLLTANILVTNHKYCDALLVLKQDINCEATAELYKCVQKYLGHFNRIL